MHVFRNTLGVRSSPTGVFRNILGVRSSPTSAFRNARLPLFLLWEGVHVYEPISLNGAAIDAQARNSPAPQRRPMPRGCLPCTRAHFESPRRRNHKNPKHHIVLGLRNRAL
eukprot:6817034-Pyramimonas_sp.AAC.1